MVLRSWWRPSISGRINGLLKSPIKSGIWVAIKRKDNCKIWSRSCVVEASSLLGRDNVCHRLRLPMFWRDAVPSASRMSSPWRWVFHCALSLQKAPHTQSHSSTSHKTWIPKVQQWWLQCSVMWCHTGSLQDAWRHVQNASLSILCYGT